MLRKILAIAFVAAMLFSFGCKKATDTTTKTSESVKQTEKDGQLITETVKKEVTKEKTVEDANP